MGKNKRSRSYYIQSAKRQKKGSVLGPGMTGFMCTCNHHERDCVREAYNILNEFADQLYGKEFSEKEATGSSSSNLNVNAGEELEKNGENNEINHSPVLETEESAVVESDSDEEPLDIDAAIKAEVSALQQNHHEQKKLRRFQQVQCGAKNCVFIQTTLDDPLPVSLAVMDEILSSQKQRTQKLLRMLPVQVTCKAYPEDIEKAVEKLASSYFKDNGKTYCVVFKVRNNSSIKKEHMVSDLARILQNVNPKNRPDLLLPDVVLNVDIMKNVCCLSLLPDYFTKYAKYNLVLLANKNKTSVSSAKTDENVKETNENKEGILKTTDEPATDSDKTRSVTAEMKQSTDPADESDKDSEETAVVPETCDVNVAKKTDTET